MSVIRLFALTSLLGCIATVASAQVTEPAPNADQLRGVCFSSFRGNESPERQILPLPSTVEQDIAMASRIAGAVRTYTVQGSYYLVPEFCDANGMDCIIGAWIGPSRWQNDAQMERLIRLASSGHQSLRAVIVGNEVLHRGDCTEAQLIGYVRQAKASLDLPVAVADTWKAWLEHPAIAAEVDICAVQIYPFWEGLPIDGAAEYTVRRVKEIQRQFPDKRIILSEFGWPTQGDPLGQAIASPENAARYLREILPLLDESEIEYYYFAIWDETWKVGAEGGVGAHWGLYTADGTLKPAFRESLPRSAHEGSSRPSRPITFPLVADSSRNAVIAHIAVGAPGPAEAGQDATDAQRGAGLQAAKGPGQFNPYSGLRPLSVGAEFPGPNSRDDQPTEPPADEESGTESDGDTCGDEPDDEPPESGDADAASQNASSTTVNSRPVQEKEGDVDDGTRVLDGVCLSLFRDGETPHFGITPLPSEIRSDIAYASTVANTVRTYSSSDNFAFAPDFCREFNVDCYPGAALGKYPWLNDQEIEMLIRLGKSGNPHIRALIVGNEVMHRGDFSVDQYIQYIRRVKQAVDVPVATAELLHSWMEHPELADEVDILGVQIYPYWGGLGIEKAAADTVYSVQQLQRRFPGKRVVLTEFGWPTDGGSLGDAEASPENAARYVREVLPLLEENGIEYLYFAMTDEKWKSQDEGGPGSHWGLLESNGKVKPCFDGIFQGAAAKGMDRPPRELSFED